MSPFRKLKEIPESLKPGAIDRAIRQFVNDSHVLDVPISKPGLIQQLTDVIASILVFKSNPTTFFWAAEDNGEVVAWALTHVSKDVDNSLCYWMTDAWVDKSLRRTILVRKWLEALKADAKFLGCKHILIPSSRGMKAYCRFLGKGWHPYLTILKEDISYG